METIKYYINLVFGSDTQTGATPAYVWLADQFGHVFIGFGGMFLVLWGISTFMRRPLPSYGFDSQPMAQRAPLSARLVWIVAGIWAAIWFAKELYDLWLAGDQAAHWLAVWKKDLIEDVATDVAFYLIGISLALAHFGMIRLRPLAVFAIMLVVAGVLVGYWITVFDSLGKTNIPHFARMTTVKLIPEPPSSALTQALQDSAPLPPACSLYQPDGEPALQCTVRGGCKRTHYIIYGLTDEDMPPPPTMGFAPASDHSNDPPNVLPEDQRKHIRAMLPELRKLGIALVAERVFRRRDGDTYYTTLLRAVEARNKESTLVIDNIERDLTRYALSLSSQNSAAFNQKISALEAILNDELGSWSKEFSEKTIIWLSLNESLAVALCRSLVKKKPNGDGTQTSNADRAVLIRAQLSSRSIPPVRPDAAAGKTAAR